MPAPLLDIVIVSYRCRDMLRDCLTSLRTFPPRGGGRIWVVDNVSGDGTVEMVSEEFPEVELIASDENLGFSKANNLAIARGSARYVLALNPDTRMVKGTLDHMLELMERKPEVGMSGCRLELPDGTFDHAARRSFPTPLGALAHFTGVGRLEKAPAKLSQYRALDVESGPVDAVNGAFMLMRREALEQAGLFDEGYWMYMEDLDLCYRFARAGWITWFEPSVKVIHIKAGTSGQYRSPRLNYAFHYGMLRFYRKHYAPDANVLKRSFIYAGIASKLGISLARNGVRRLWKRNRSRPAPIAAEGEETSALSPARPRPVADKPLLSLIIVSREQGKLLKQCLASARVALQEIGGATELILILNGAPAPGSALEDELFEGAEVVREPENIGFAPAVAEGVRLAAGEWVALLNDDATIERPALVRMLTAAASAADVGSVAAQMRFADRPQIINSAGVELDKLGVASDRLLGEPVSASETEVIDVFGASGGCALYRREMLDDIGGFDESFFAYLEDVDVAWRARMGGWRCLYVPEAVALHHHSATLGHESGRKYFLVGRNRVRLLAKNASSAQLRRHGARIVLHELGYVTYVAFAQLSLAPLRGRIVGLGEWKRYRRAGAEGRCEIPLTRSGGFRAALRRRGVWAGKS